MLIPGHIAGSCRRTLQFRDVGRAFVSALRARKRGSRHMRYPKWQRSLVSMMVATFLIPLHAWGGAAPLGTARAVRGVKATLDNGTTWLELKGNALPVFAGTEVRSA